LSPTLVSEQRAEQTSLLRRAYEELRSETGDIAKDLFKSYVKEAIKKGAVPVLLSIAAWFTRNGKDKKGEGDRMAGRSHHELAHLLDKQPKTRSVTAQDVATECACTPVQAVAMLKYLGFQEHEGVWVAPQSPV
jgi:hypothetical protein